MCSLSSLVRFVWSICGDHQNATVKSPFKEGATWINTVNTCLMRGVHGCPKRPFLFRSFMVILYWDGIKLKLFSPWKIYILMSPWMLNLGMQWMRRKSGCLWPFLVVSPMEMFARVVCPSGCGVSWPYCPRLQGLVQHWGTLSMMPNLESPEICMIFSTCEMWNPD